MSLSSENATIIDLLAEIEALRKDRDEWKTAAEGMASLAERNHNEIERLLDDVESLREETRVQNELLREWEENWKEPRERAEHAEAERDQYRKDAERYRWLRANCYKPRSPDSEYDNSMQLLFTVSGVWLDNMDPRVLDGCIDDAAVSGKEVA